MHCNHKHVSTYIMKTILRFPSLSFHRFTPRLHNLFYFYNLLFYDKDILHNLSWAWDWDTPLMCTFMCRAKRHETCQAIPQTWLIKSFGSSMFLYDQSISFWIDMILMIWYDMIWFEIKFFLLHLAANAPMTINGISYQAGDSPALKLILENWYIPATIVPFWLPNNKACNV
jgi:hypothetical protein